MWIRKWILSISCLRTNNLDDQLLDVAGGYARPLEVVGIQHKPNVPAAWRTGYLLYLNLAQARDITPQGSMGHAGDMGDMGSYG